VGRNPIEADVESTRERLEAALAGDREAERRLFDEHRAWLVEQARRERSVALLRPHVSLDDLVHEVFVRVLTTKALEGRFQDRGTGSLRRYLVTILRRVVVDEVRRQRAIKRGANARTVSFDEGDGLGAPMASPHPSADDPSPTSNARAAELLALCRRELSEEEWKVWDLVEGRGLSSKEAGELLGSSPAAVRGVLFRAKRRLLEILGEGPP